MSHSIQLLAALDFAADKHQNQRRKGRGDTPYVNHVIGVAHTLATVGGITDVVTLCAAILHDTLEDTDTTVQELDDRFGEEVRAVVEEVTDDKSLPNDEHQLLDHGERRAVALAYSRATWSRSALSARSLP